MSVRRRDLHCRKLLRKCKCPAEVKSLADFMKECGTGIDLSGHDADRTETILRGRDVRRKHASGITQSNLPQSPSGIRKFHCLLVLEHCEPSVRALQSRETVGETFQKVASFEHGPSVIGFQAVAQPGNDGFIK
jgi:hypothetical protein